MICAASTAGSGAQTRATNAACTTSNKATRQRLKGLATRHAAQRGTLRKQLAAGVTNNNEQRLTGQARCEYSWQRRTSNDEQRGSSGTALGTICPANTTGSGAQATRLAPRAQLTARIAVNNEQCKQATTTRNLLKPHATCQLAVAVAQTYPKIPTYLCRQKSADFNLIFSSLRSFNSCSNFAIVGGSGGFGVVASCLAILG